MAFTDDFSGEVSDVDLASHTPSGGTAWSRVGGVANSAEVFSASSDAGVPGSAAATNTLYQCDDQGNSAQYIQCSYLPSSTASFLANRATDANNFVGVRVSGAKVQIFKRVAGSFTQLGSTGSTTVSSGDTIKLESDGSDVHTAFINGSSESGPGGTDTAHSSVTTQGFCARLESGSDVSVMDDFEAGVLGGGVTNPKGPFGLFLHGPFGGPV